MRYADDVVLIASSMEELQNLVDRVKESSEDVGLSMNAKKTKVMKILCNDINDDTSIVVDGEPLEIVSQFTYLGALFTADGDDTPEIKRRIAIAKNATTALTTVWRDRSISLKTKLRLLNALVFPIATYGSETWIVKKSDWKRLNSFELWCYRRILRISWMDRLTNEEVLRRAQNPKRLLNSIIGRRLSYLGHILRSDTLERELIVGMVYGTRKRGRPKTRYKDNIKEELGMSIVQAFRAAQDRHKWRNLMKEATATHRLSLP